MRSFCLALAMAALLVVIAASEVRSQQSASGQAPKAAAAAGAKSAAGMPASSLGLEVRHIHIRVMDVERTKAFYRDKLGFTVANETPGSVVEFPGLWFGKWRGSGPIPVGGITIGLASKSVDASYAQLKKRGISIANPPAQAHDAWSFTFKDPDGYDVEIEGPK